MRGWNASPRPPRGIAQKLLCLSALIATSSHTATTSCRMPLARGAKDNNIVVFSGGTAWNGLAHAMSLKGFYCAYVLPVSDDGGSTSEIRRVFGGPAIGDIRSRLSRVETPSASPSSNGLRALLRLRLDEESAAQALVEWQALLADNHHIWKGVTGDEFEWVAPVRTLLRLLNEHLFSRQHPHVIFRQGDEGGINLSNASVGNLFLTALRLHLGSLDASIEWLARQLGVAEVCTVLPCTLFDDIAASCCRRWMQNDGLIGMQLRRDHVGLLAPGQEDLPRESGGGELDIGVRLSNGDLIVGQSEISHPPIPTRLPTDQRGDGPANRQRPMRRSFSVDKNLGSHDLALPASVDRVFYVTRGGSSERAPQLDLNPRVAEVLARGTVFLFGPGSLYTSIVPSLLLPGVGEAIAAAGARGARRLLLLNAGGYPRVPGHPTPACDVCQCDDELTESGPGPDRESASMTASGVVGAFCAALSRYGDLSLSPGRVLDGIVVSEGCTIPVDTDELASMGISIHHVRCACEPGDVSHKGGHFCPMSFASDLIRA